MLYLVKSNAPTLREKIIDKIVKSSSNTDIELFTYDFEEDKSIEEAFFEYSSISIDGSQKIIIVKNANFINAKTIEKDFEKNFVQLIDSKIDNIIIFAVDKLNKTGKINKKYSESFTLLEKDAPEKNELIKFIETFFKNNEISIEKNIPQEIYNRLGDNFDLIVSELNKLEMLNSKNIDIDTIKNTLLDFSRERLYAISDCVFKKDIAGISRLIKQLISEGETPYLIGDALNRVGFGFLRYSILKEKNYSDRQISEITGWNSWMINNYSAYSPYWKDSSEIYDFYYETIVEDLFFDFIKHQPKDGLKQIERLLISAVTK